MAVGERVIPMDRVKVSLSYRRKSHKPLAFLCPQHKPRLVTYQGSIEIILRLHVVVGYSSVSARGSNGVCGFERLAVQSM